MSGRTADAPKSRGASLLVVDDDPAIGRILRDRFRAAGYDVEVAADGEAALAAASARPPDLVLLDLQMPGMDGFEVLRSLRARSNPPEVVVITAHGSIEAAVRAVRAGAADLLAKPFDAAHLEHVVAGVLEKAGLSRRVESLEREISGRHHLVVGESRAMRDAHAIAMRAAASDATVLLLGESGTGKEVIARAIHQASKRSRGPFIALNCAALAAELVESELFGHERGAFTGAQRSKAGKIELAGQGTLFLDEVGELAPAVQAKLLRVLQEREFERVGGERTLAADVRVVAATNRDLAAAIAEGRFRHDLYYRLNVVSLRLPPLRERTEDIGPLVDHFLRRFSLDSGRPELRLSREAREALLAYSWPGNVRELANVVERAVVLSIGEVVGLESLPEEIAEQRPKAAGDPHRAAEGRDASAQLLPYHEAVARAKQAIIREALGRTGGHQTRAAQLLELTQPYLARLMKNLGLKG